MTPSTYRLINSVFVRFVKKTPIRTEKFPERALDALQRNLVDVVRPLMASPIAGGNLFADVDFTSGVDRQLSHLLDQAYSGWIISRIRGNAARFLEVPQSLDLNDRFLTLQADADCTADVYVF